MRRRTIRAQLIRPAGIPVELVSFTATRVSNTVKLAWRTVTEANNRAIALYKRIGFVSNRVFDAFVWEG